MNYEALSISLYSNEISNFLWSLHSLKNLQFHSSQELQRCQNTKKTLFLSLEKWPAKSLSINSLDHSAKIRNEKKILRQNCLKKKLLGRAKTWTEEATLGWAIVSYPEDADGSNIDYITWERPSLQLVVKASQRSLLFVVHINIE